MGENPAEEANNDCIFFTTREDSIKKVKMLSAVALLAAAGAANAGVSSTITATNDYDFRGVSQSATDPAIQASLDYAHDSGFYVGAWASTIDFGPGSDADFELDLYAGFVGKINDDMSWEVGLIDYTYPGQTDIDTLEFYGAFTYKWFKAKVSYSDDAGGSGNDSLYLDATATVPLPANFSLIAHIGQSSGAAYSDNIIDYSIGVGYTISNFVLGLKYTDTDTTASKGNRNTGDVFNNEGRVIFTVATTLPWK
jgi:uncharacterized protein (TIGR02001 family)